MSCQNVTFLTQNNCFHVESTRHFNNENYCVLHHRVKLQTSFKITSVKNSFFLRSFTSGRQKIDAVLKFLFPIYLILFHDLVFSTQAATTQYWTCDWPNRQLYVGRSAEHGLRKRTIDSSRMDPAHFEARSKCSFCDLIYSYRPVNNTHRV